MRHICGRVVKLVEFAGQTFVLINNTIFERFPLTPKQAAFEKRK